MLRCVPLFLIFVLLTITIAGAAVEEVSAQNSTGQGNDDHEEEASEFVSVLNRLIFGRFKTVEKTLVHLEEEQNSSVARNQLFEYDVSTRVDVIGAKLRNLSIDLKQELHQTQMDLEHKFGELETQIQSIGHNLGNSSSAGAGGVDSMAATSNGLIFRTLNNLRLSVESLKENQASLNSKLDQLEGGGGGTVGNMEMFSFPMMSNISNLDTNPDLTSSLKQLESELTHLMGRSVYIEKNLDPSGPMSDLDFHTFGNFTTLKPVGNGNTKLSIDDEDHSLGGIVEEEIGSGIGPGR